MSKIIALVGPQLRETTLFNAPQEQSPCRYWPGVTVERKEGQFRHGNEVLTIVDLPGISAWVPFRKTRWLSGFHFKWRT